jgi:hypothetical protein
VELTDYHPCFEPLHLEPSSLPLSLLLPGILEIPLLLSASLKLFGIAVPLSLRIVKPTDRFT